ncbi:MAG: 7-carboxy-7-deazaguanine synthase QueE [Bacteroidales bacterium]|nr:7-carboxy-7-deazaguanine synthase QueE [Bacteroidales bacterium]
MISRKTEKEGEKLPLAEEFYSLQGEGFHAGKPAYLIRLAGCDIGCSWCDTSFSWDADKHPLVDIDEIVNNAVASGARIVVVTGGEPLMWNLDHLCESLKRNNICTYLETSGAHRMSGKWDWICLSPKIHRPPLPENHRMADELKVIIQTDDDFKWAEKSRLLVRDECHLFLQPEWSVFESVIPAIVSYIRQNPIWRLSLQVHKFMHIP